MLMAVSYPSILNTMQTRNLENTTRRVQTYLQLTKLRAVSTKITHRVRFTRVDESYWAVEMEQAQIDGTWVRAEGAPRKTIPNNLNVTLDLPVDGSDPIIVFSPLGTVANFTTDQNSITLLNPKLRPPEPDGRAGHKPVHGGVHPI